MKSVLIFSVIATATLSHFAWGQSASSPPTRAEVKAETKEALQNDGTRREDFKEYRPTPVTGTSTRTRAQRKAETRAAEKAGRLIPAGEATQPDMGKSGGAGKSRAEIKSGTRAAQQGNQLTPAGEGPDAAKK